MDRISCITVEADGISRWKDICGKQRNPNLMAELTQWFPTFDWFEEYSGRLNSNRRYRKHSKGWGEDFDGDFIFQVDRIPTDRHKITEFPDDLLRIDMVPQHVWNDVPDPIERKLRDEAGDRPVYEAFDLFTEQIHEDMPDHVRKLFYEAREVFDRNPTYDDVPDELSKPLREALPPELESLLRQLEDFVTDDHQAFAYMSFEDGRVVEIDMLDSHEDREHGFRISGPYRFWREFIEGDDDIVETVLAGDLQPKGEMPFLLEYTDALMEMGETAKRIDARYIF